VKVQVLVDCILDRLPVNRAIIFTFSNQGGNASKIKYYVN